MIGADHGLHPVPDIVLVLIGGDHQIAQLRQEFIDVEFDRHTDMNQIVFRPAEALLRHELFLIQLFPGPQAGINDLDILIGLEAGETDQVPGQIVDFDRAAHIQHEDFPAAGVSG